MLSRVRETDVERMMELGQSAGLSSNNKLPRGN
jgi:hypothetical protein